MYSQGLILWSGDYLTQMCHSTGQGGGGKARSVLLVSLLFVVPWNFATQACGSFWHSEKLRFFSRIHELL